MARNREARFFECFDCKTGTLLPGDGSEMSCPGCESANGRVISGADLERDLDTGAVFNIDLTSGRLRGKR
jgi:hypothetical protein